MLKPINYIEVTVKKINTKETGLLLKYDEVDQMLRLSLDGRATTGAFSLTFGSVTSIVIKDAEGLVDRLFTEASHSQKLAIELLLEATEQLRKDGRLNASGFVNLASYKDVPEKYKKVETLQLPIVHNNVHTYTPATPKIGFLVTKTNYANGYQPAKKIAILFRKSELPSARLITAMRKRAAAAFDGTYKLKTEPLHEDDREEEKEPETNLIGGVYGDYDDDYMTGYARHGGMM